MLDGSVAHKSREPTTPCRLGVKVAAVKLARQRDYIDEARRDGPEGQGAPTPGNRGVIAFAIMADKAGRNLGMLRVTNTLECRFDRGGGRERKLELSLDRSLGIHKLAKLDKIAGRTIEDDRDHQGVGTPHEHTRTTLTLGTLKA